VQQVILSIIVALAGAAVAVACPDRAGAIIIMSGVAVGLLLRAQGRY